MSLDTLNKIGGRRKTLQNYEDMPVVKTHPPRETPTDDVYLLRAASFSALPVPVTVVPLPPPRVLLAEVAFAVAQGAIRPLFVDRC